jgi:Flp pilus assembly protein TadG
MKRKEKGVTFAVVCLVLVVLLGMAALTVDMGVLYTARTSAQHAADAAALAGAFTYVTTPTAPDPAELARQHATSIATEQKMLGRKITTTEVQVLPDPVRRTVQVTITRVDNPVFFAKVFGLGDPTIQVVATAEASKHATRSRCIRPFWIPNTAMSSLSPEDACSSEVLLDDEHELTAWGKQQLGKVMPDGVWKESMPSQYGLLEFQQQAVGPTLEECILFCECGANLPNYKCGERVPVKVGDTVGKVGNPMIELIEQGAGQDTWVDVGKYLDPVTGTVSDTSKNLINVVIWDNCHDIPLTPGSHHQTVEVVGYGMAFVDHVYKTGPNKFISAHLVNVGSCGEGVEDPGTGGFAAIPVRLVQNEPQE